MIFSGKAQADISYPAMRIQKQNPAAAQSLLDILASPSGEMTAIHQYLYQSWILANVFPQLTQQFQQIARVEMYHMDLLGQVIVLLGGVPKFQSDPFNCATAWNGNHVYYSHQATTLLEYNLAQEEVALKAYLQLAKEFPDPYVCTLFSRIAMDEEQHCRILREGLRCLCGRK